MYFWNAIYLKFECVEDLGSQFLKKSIFEMLHLKFECIEGQMFKIKLFWNAQQTQNYIGITRQLVCILHLDFIEILHVKIESSFCDDV